MMLFPTIRADWLVAPVHDQASADAAIPEMGDWDAPVKVVQAALRGPLDLTEHLTKAPGFVLNTLSRFYRNADGTASDFNKAGDGKLYDRVVKSPLPFDLLIVAGEVGPDAKPLHPDWVRMLRDQCQAAGVPFWFAGWGEWEVWERLSNREVAPSNLDWLAADGTIYLGQMGDAVPVHRVGAAYTGRELDGRKWSGLPKAVTQ